MPKSLNNWKYVDYVHQRFLPFIDNSDIGTVDEILRLYSINSSTATPELCVTSLVSDMRATCPLDEMARVAASVSRSPIYRFQVRENFMQTVKIAHKFVLHRQKIRLSCDVIG